MADAFKIGQRYRDTRTGHHVLFLYVAPADHDADLEAQWGYTVTSQPDGLISDEIGTLQLVGAEHFAHYLELQRKPSELVAELRNIIGALFDEVDPSDPDGEWDADRLPVLALAACTLFEAVDSHLQDGGSLPFEWNPYVAAQPCHVPHMLCDAHDDPNHCRCMKRRCDGHHRCACGHWWGTPQG